MGELPPTRRRRLRRSPEAASHALPIAALLPVIACFLGGATEKWAEGIVVALLGLLFVFRPPTGSLGPAVHAVLLAFVALAAVAFLPASWFHLPPWREALGNDFAIQLPGTLSPQPWITANCLASLLAGLAWLYYVCAREREGRAIPTALRVFAFGVLALAGLSIALYFAKSALPFWHNQRGFGPFPNRNQTADLFGITSVVILACGHDDLRRGQKRWILWATGFALLLTAIVLNLSRAGLLIVVFGSALWLATLLFRGGSAARLAVGVSVLLALVASILLFGGQTLERFHLRAVDGGSTMSADFRWLIFRDTAELISATPWPGIGLGNFSPVFGIFRAASTAQNRALHPESDWLWVAAEVGWPAVLLIVIGAILLARRVFPLRDGTHQRLRLAAFVAAMLFALHGLIDVSGHRVGSAYAALFLFGLSLGPQSFRRSALVPVVSRVVGLLLCALGAVWIFAALRDWPLPGGLGVDRERQLATAANQRREFAATIEHATRALEWAPLDWQLYFVRAIGQVGRGAREEALEDFRRARFLEPGSFEVPYQEGLTWITQQPTLTLTAWREALRRAGPERAALYGRMLSVASQLNADFGRTLEKFGRTQPELALIALERANAQSFAEIVEQLLANDPTLESLKAEQKARLFTLWGERGDLGRLQMLVAANPALEPLAWRGLARHAAADGDYHAAAELAQRYITAPKLPDNANAETTEQLQRNLFTSPNDYSRGFALYQRQIDARQVDDALITVRRFTEQPQAPAYFHFLEARAWAAAGNWERAWNAWRKFDPKL